MGWGEVGGGGWNSLMRSLQQQHRKERERETERERERERDTHTHTHTDSAMEEVGRSIGLSRDAIQHAGLVSNQVPGLACTCWIHASGPARAGRTVVSQSWPQRASGLPPAAPRYAACYSWVLEAT